MLDLVEGPSTTESYALLAMMVCSSASGTDRLVKSRGGGEVLTLVSAQEHVISTTTTKHKSSWRVLNKFPKERELFTFTGKKRFQCEVTACEHK